LNIVDGKMQYLFDEDGHRYLDAFGGIATVCCGHCHPDVVEAMVNQAKRIQHSTVLYLNHAIADFAEALASKMPGDLKVFAKKKLQIFLYLKLLQNGYVLLDD
jgi:alanine-glyoxylate transaminase/(R)-3-amino-2-methylpropionate-pyruvate transaminase